MADEAPQLYLIDGHSLLFKAYFAIRSLTSPKGVPTNAVFGFVKMIQKLIRDRKPTHCLAVFDSAGPTFREEIYEDYKANRPPPPDDFIVQEPYVEKWLKAQGIARMALPGFEADDLIGTLARQASHKGFAVMIVSADKDLFQLVDDNVKLLRFLADDMQVYDAQMVKEKMGVTPEQIIDYLALTGDTSDNIPGVPSIGPKSASVLLAEFGSLDGIYAHLEQIKREKQRQVLQDNHDKALLSRQLSTINCESPVKLDLGKWSGHTRPDVKALSGLYEELGFRSLLEDLRRADGTPPETGTSKYVVASAGATYG
ncbi:MAG: 5'-3' exonuclease H3TH domain-containing protein, partial [bacterium]